MRGQEELNRLIDHRLVRFAYQPVLEVATGSVYGYELLMRSQVEALRSPVDVLRIARAQSKLYQIERLTWFEAMASFSQQVKAGQIGPNERAFVNSIASQSLTGSDITALEDLYGPYLERVVMEITEQEPWDNERTRFKIRTAKRWGGQLDIDDFGSGYNSESLLIFLSPDIVKGDIAIVRDIDRDGDRLRRPGRKYGDTPLQTGRLWPPRLVTVGHRRGGSGDKTAERCGFWATFPI